VKPRSLRNHIVAFGVAGVLLCVAVSEVSARAQGKQGGADNSSGKSSSTSSSGKSNSSSSSKSGSSSNSSRSGGGSSRSSNSGRDNRSGGNNRSGSSGSSSGGSGSSSSARTSNRHENKNPDRDKGPDRGINETVRSENRLRDRLSEGSSLSTTTARNSSRNKNRDDRNGDGRRGHHDHGRGFNRGRDGSFADWHRDQCERGRHYYPTRVYEAANYNNYSYGLSAYEQGYEDGLRTGASDAWQGQSYEPERSHFYKHGAGGFLAVFGSRASYASAYRDGFLRGYEEGYQNYSSYFVGGKFRR